MEKSVGKSHLIIESPSMGLITRYICEMDFTTQIDFCSAVQIRMGERVIDFEFEELVAMKKQ